MVYINVHAAISPVGAAERVYAPAKSVGSCLQVFTHEVSVWVPSQIPLPSHPSPLYGRISIYLPAP